KTSGLATPRTAATPATPVSVSALSQARRTASARASAGRPVGSAAGTKRVSSIGPPTESAAEPSVTIETASATRPYGPGPRSLGTSVTSRTIGTASAAFPSALSVSGERVRPRASAAASSASTDPPAMNRIVIDPGGRLEGERPKTGGSVGTGPCRTGCRAARDCSEPEPAFGGRTDDTSGAVGDPCAMFTFSNRFEIGVLGPFQVGVDGRPVDMTGSKRDALLALLALRRGRHVPVDTLIDELWGADVPAAPRNAVQHHIARLRAALGQTSIVGCRDGYAVVGATTDAIVFEGLLVRARAAGREGDPRTAADLADRALALWRGPALQGLPEIGWLRAEADRLEDLRIDALEERFEAALALGEHREIVSELQHAIDECPFRERLWRQLMLALYRSGRQADALEAYRTARRVHVDQLGLEPGPELRRIQDAILAHDPELAAAPAPAVQPAEELDERRRELGRVLDQMRENLRHAEELYERACSAAAGDDLELATLAACPGTPRRKANFW